FFLFWSAAGIAALVFLSEKEKTKAAILAALEKGFVSAGRSAGRTGAKSYDVQAWDNCRCRTRKNGRGRRAGNSAPRPPRAAGGGTAAAPGCRRPPYRAGTQRRGLSAPPSPAGTGRRPALGG